MAGVVGNFFLVSMLVNFAGKYQEFFANLGVFSPTIWRILLSYSLHISISDRPLLDFLVLKGKSNEIFNLQVFFIIRGQKSRVGNSIIGVSMELLVFVITRSIRSWKRLNRARRSFLKIDGMDLFMIYLFLFKDRREWIIIQNSYYVNCCTVHRNVKIQDATGPCSLFSFWFYFSVIPVIAANINCMHILLCLRLWPKT